jgi:hypothetical protein
MARRGGGVFHPIKFKHKEKAPWEKITHVRLLTAYPPETAAAKRVIGHISMHADRSGVAAPNAGSRPYAYPSIPPKYAVSQVVGFIKGKSAIHVAREFFGRRKNFTGEEFWARGYHVSTVGRNEEAIRRYIKEQEREDRRIDQLKL